MVMAAVAEQPPPPCFFSLSLRLPRPFRTPPPPDLFATSLHSLLLSVTVPTVLLFSPLCVTMDTLELPSSTSNSPPFSPTPLPRFSLLTYISSSSSRALHTFTRLPWATRCYSQAIRAYYILRLPVSSPHPLPASHLGVCVGRNQGQECNQPTTAPYAIDSLSRISSHNERE